MYKCKNCGQEYDDLELMRYNPYEKTRYCIECYERLTNHKIYKPVEVKPILFGETSEEEEC